MRFIVFLFCLNVDFVCFSGEKRLHEGTDEVVEKEKPMNKKKKMRNKKK